jgi:putative phage-type endonuclease
MIDMIEAKPLTLAQPDHDRQKYIGGSDIAAVLGVSPWKSPLDLWRDKTTPRVADKPKEVFKRGVRWESVVAEMVTEALVKQGHTVNVVSTNRRYIDCMLPFLAAEIDYEVKLDGSDEITNIELKTVHPFGAKSWGESGTDTLPIHYMAQVMHGLGVTGRRGAMLAALFGADELRVYRVDADDETIAGMRAHAGRFWTEHVMTGISPPPVNLADLSSLFERDSPTAKPLLADEQLTQQLLRMRAISAEIKAREAEAEALEFEIKRAMRDCTSILLPNGKTACEWKERNGTFIDAASLKAAHPKIAKEFTSAWHKRVFALKSFSMEGI